MPRARWTIRGIISTRVATCRHDRPAPARRRDPSSRPVAAARRRDVAARAFATRRRRRYVDGAAVDTHLANAVPIVGKMLDCGCVELDGIEFHGPKAEWPKFKEAADALGAVYYDVDASFSKFKL